MERIGETRIPVAIVSVKSSATRPKTVLRQPFRAKKFELTDEVNDLAYELNKTARK